MTKIYFISFGGPSNDYHNAVNRICNQASQFNMFFSIKGYTEQDLINDKDFWEKNGNFILNSSKGYGYWIWKPYLILKTLKNMDDNDILIYLDSGCELNVNGKELLNKYIERAKNKLIIGTYGGSCDVKFSKKDLIKFLDMENNNTLEQVHMQAGVVIMKKCDIILKLYSECYKIASENHHLVDDSPSISPNPPNFIEHRHDQSIFNLLLKKYNLLNYDLNEYCDLDASHSFAKNHYLNKAMHLPIWISRNRTGKSIIE